MAKNKDCVNGINKKEEYIKAVKYNLRAFLQTVNYDLGDTDDFNDDIQKMDLIPKGKSNTLGVLVNALDKKAADDNNTYHLEKLHDKLYKLIHTGNEHLDPYFITEICELYHFPPEKIFSHKRTTPKQAEEIMKDVANQTSMRQKNFAPLSKLTHKSYFGDFYGYTYDHNPNENNRIVKFKFSIYEDEELIPKAEYTFYNANHEKQVFTGIPYYVAELKAICIEMSASNNRRYQYLYLNGAPYNAQTLTYKNGVCVRTSTASRNHEPDVKSFILVNRELTDDIVQEIVPGLLKMSSNDFYITRAQLEKLEQENSTIKEFHANHSIDFQLIENSVYLVKERKIIESTKYEDKTERIAAFTCLTKIRALALSPDRITYRNTEADYNFFKQFDQEISDVISY